MQPLRARCPAAHGRLRRLSAGCLAAPTGRDTGGSPGSGVRTFVSSGGCPAIEVTGVRDLFVHPNTVRYCLRHVDKLTGRLLTDPRATADIGAALLAVRNPGGSLQRTGQTDTLRRDSQRRGKASALLALELGGGPLQSVRMPFVRQNSTLVTTNLPPAWAIGPYPGGEGGSWACLPREPLLPVPHSPQQPPRGSSPSRDPRCPALRR
ncbi:helix-turn-helix domain-containing protein [Streptomyces sp. NPDC055013]